MTQEERDWMYDTAYRLDSSKRFSWSELADQIKRRRMNGSSRIVVLNGDVLEEIAERIRDITEKDGSRLVQGIKNWPSAARK